MKPNTPEILVVDDDDVFRKFMANYIEQTVGYMPYQSSNGKEALAHIQNHPVDLLITDTNMPEMNGVDLLVEAKECDPTLKVIVLFCGLHGSKIEESEILRMGAHMVLSKPEVPSRLFPFLRGYASELQKPSNPEYERPERLAETSAHRALCRPRF